MKDFMRYSKNRFLFFVLKIAIIIFLAYIGSLFLIIPKVKADVVTDSSVVFNYCDNLTKVCQLSNQLFMPNASLSIRGAGSSVEFNKGNYTYLAGVRFWTDITAKKGQSVTIDYVLLLKDIREQETYQSDWLNDKSNWYSSTNFTIDSVKMISNSFSENGYLSNVDGNPVQLGTQRYELQVTGTVPYDFNDNSIYVGFGSYSTNSNLSSKLLYQHLASVTVDFFYNSFSVSGAGETDFSGIINEQEKTNEKLDDLNSSITDDTPPDAPDFKDIALPSDTPISDLILMPINLLNKFISDLGKSCTPYNIPFNIFDSDYTLTLPCINIKKYLGDNLWHIIDLLFCFYMCYNIGMLAVKMFNDFTSMRDTYDSLYEPQHAYSGYKPKHGGD